MENKFDELEKLNDKSKDFALLHSTIYFLLIIINSDEPDKHKENISNVLE